MEELLPTGPPNRDDLDESWENCVPEPLTGATLPCSQQPNVVPPVKVVLDDNKTVTAALTCVPGHHAPQCPLSGGSEDEVDPDWICPLDGDGDDDDDNIPSDSTRRRDRRHRHRHWGDKPRTHHQSTAEANIARSRAIDAASHHPEAEELVKEVVDPKRMQEMKMLIGCLNLLVDVLNNAEYRQPSSHGGYLGSHQSGHPFDTGNGVIEWVSNDDQSDDDHCGTFPFDTGNGVIERVPDDY